MDDGTHIENNWEADWDLAEQTAHDIEVDQHINSQRGKSAIWYVAVCGRQQARLAIPGLANLVALWLNLQVARGILATQPGAYLST